MTDVRDLSEGEQKEEGWKDELRKSNEGSVDVDGGSGGGPVVVVVDVGVDDAAIPEEDVDADGRALLEHSRHSEPDGAAEQRGAQRHIRRQSLQHQSGVEEHPRKRRRL